MKTLCVTLLLVVSTASLASADVIYDVTINTAPLIGHPAGPFAIGLQLADDSGAGNNEAVLSNFQFGAEGSPLGSPFTLGSSFGDLSSVVVLSDTTTPNIFTQSFVPGTTLSFVLDITTNPDPANDSEEFGFYILDSTGTPIPTTAGLPNALFSVLFDDSGTLVSTFSGDPSTAPAGGGSGIPLGAPDVSPATATPEPPFAGLTLGVGGLILILSRIRHNTPGGPVVEVVGINELVGQ